MYKSTMLKLIFKYSKIVFFTLWTTQNYDFIIMGASVSGALVEQIAVFGMSSETRRAYQSDLITF